MNKVVFSKRHQAYINGYDGKSYKIWNTTKGLVSKIRYAIREHYKTQQRYMCCYCRQQTIQDHGFVWDCEHILPKAIFPLFLFEPLNLALSCKACNLAKEAYKNQIIKISPKAYSTNSEDYQIIHPHFDTYSDHLSMKCFESTTVYEILNNSAKGSFTYKCCGFDRYDKKLAGYNNVTYDIAKTISNLIENGISSSDILDGLLKQTIPIDQKTDF